MTKQQTIELLNSQMPSFYSREQVIDMITKIEDARIDLKKLRDSVVELIESNILSLDSGIVDYRSAEFSLSGNEILLDDVDLDTTVIRETILDGVEDLFEEEEK